MRKIKACELPKSSIMVSVTPDQLRMIANRLEHEAINNTIVGQVICYPATEGITFVYEPKQLPTTNGFTAAWDYKKNFIDDVPSERVSLEPNPIF